MYHLTPGGARAQTSPLSPHVTPPPSGASRSTGRHVPTRSWYGGVPCRRVVVQSPHEPLLAPWAPCACVCAWYGAGPRSSAPSPCRCQSGALGGAPPKGRAGRGAPDPGDCSMVSGYPTGPSGLPPLGGITYATPQGPASPPAASSSPRCSPSAIPQDRRHDRPAGAAIASVCPASVPPSLGEGGALRKTLGDPLPLSLDAQRR